MCTEKHHTKLHEEKATSALAASYFLTGETKVLYTPMYAYVFR